MNKPVPGIELMQSARSDAFTDRKICIVTGELEGPNFNGGVGTTNRALAIVLRELGYDVDILYTQIDDGEPRSTRGEFADHVTDYANLGIRLMCINNQSPSHDWQARSFLALQHLLRHQYRLVFFDDLFGTAYYPLLARKTGNEWLQKTIMCVTTHGSMEWTSDVNRQAIMNFETLPLIEMERRSVELADVVKAPSAYILEKYRKYGWAIARDFIVLPNFVSQITMPHKPIRRGVGEIVFFGRLERRKGLRMFCNALDRIKFELKDCTVTFLGKALPEVMEKLVQKSATWPFRTRLLTQFNQAQAVSYLKTGDRLAVMPSTEDNSPSVIIECLQANIPFLASSGSGGEELLDEESRKENLFEPSVDGLCNKLLQAINSGAMTARAAFNPEEITRAFAEWVENTLRSARPASRPKTKAPLSRKAILIVIVPPDISIDQSVANLKKAFVGFHGRIRIEVLASQPKPLAKRIASLGKALPVNVSHVSDFSKISKAVGRLDPAILGICHIRQLITPEWFERARTCFQNTESISAVTGMAGEAAKAEELPARRYVSAVDKRHEIRRYLMGNAPPLFALVQSTNSGFLLMRSELLPLLGATALFDEKYDRLLGMEYLIHAMLIKLHRSGHNFELVPDLLHRALGEIPVTNHESPDFLRSLATDLYGHAAGSDQWLLSRLAIDSGLQHDRFRTSDEYRNYLSAKTGIKLSPVNANTTWEQQSRELAMLAQTSGQIELSTDLVSRLVFPRIPLQTLGATERISTAAEIVSLMDLISSAACVKINLVHDWSLQWDEGNRSIRLHANCAREGRAALLFKSVDLSKVTLFTCNLTSPKGANPVRTRLDIGSLDRTQAYSADKILNADEDATWEVAVPEKLRTECKVTLSVEMADPSDDTEHGYVSIEDPCFVSGSLGNLQ
jgi:glycosyltransferase involved in cell wall biosynthesis